MIAVVVVVDAVLSDIDVGADVLVGASANVLAAVMTALMCATPAPVEIFSCWAACSR